MADDDAPQTLAEITANLAEYKEQLEQVRASPPLPIHRFGSCRARAFLTRSSRTAGGTTPGRRA